VGETAGTSTERSSSAIGGVCRQGAQLQRRCAICRAGLRDRPRSRLDVGQPDERGTPAGFVLRYVRLVPPTDEERGG
jgi:hypothetical protein